MPTNTNFTTSVERNLLNYQALLDFSLGHTDNLQVMETLAIESEEDLFLLMAQAHLPMPHLPEYDTQKMVGQLNNLLKP